MGRLRDQDHWTAAEDELGHGGGEGEGSAATDATVAVVVFPVDVAAQNTHGGCGTAVGDVPAHEASGGGGEGSVSADKATRRPRRSLPPWTWPRGGSRERYRCGRGRGEIGGAGAAAVDKATVRPQKMSPPWIWLRGMAV